MKKILRSAIRLVILAVGLTSGLPAQARPPIVLTTARSKITETYLHTFDSPVSPSHDLVFFMARPPKITYQPDMDSSMTIVGRSYVPTEVVEASLPADSPDYVPEQFRRRLWQIRVPAKEIGSGPIVVQITYTGTRCEQKLADGKAGPFNLSQEERSFYLKPTSRLDFQSQEFKSWMNLNQLWRHEQAREPKFRFAERVFTFIKEYYLDEPWLEADLPVSKFCLQRRPSWQNVAVLVTAILRANGIPAVTAYNTTFYTTPRLALFANCRFFEDTLGWMTIETGVVFDANRHSGRYDFRYFGYTDGYSTTVHLGSDINLPLSLEDGGPRQVPWLPGVVNNYDLPPTEVKLTHKGFAE